MSDLLTIAEVCDALDIKPARLRQLRAAGVITPARWYGNTPVYSRESVEKAKTRERGRWSPTFQRKQRKRDSR